MTICCSKCHIKDEIPCFGFSQYAIKAEAAKAGWYMNTQGALICPECRNRNRGSKK